MDSKDAKLTEIEELLSMDWVDYIAQEGLDLLNDTEFQELIFDIGYFLGFQSGAHGVYKQIEEGEDPELAYSEAFCFSLHLGRRARYYRKLTKLLRLGFSVPKLESKVFTYGLLDPRDNKFRYIGKSKAPTRRFQQHLREKGKDPKNKWIEELKQLGLEPEIHILDVSDFENSRELEKVWIFDFLDTNSLFNKEVFNRKLKRRREISQLMDAIIEKERRTTR